MLILIIPFYSHNKLIKWDYDYPCVANEKTKEDRLSNLHDAKQLEWIEAGAKPG